MAGMIEDPEAKARSIMLKQKALCSGEQTGRMCVHYWAHVEKVESNNPDFLRRGEMYRVCGFHPSIAHEMTADQLATECNQYKPRKLPIWKRPLRLLRLVDDPGKYDPHFEDYNPLSREEMKALQDALPSSSRALTEMSAIVAKAEERRAAPEVSLEEALGDLDGTLRPMNSGGPGGEADEGIFAKKED